jgi:hypothetical protein
VDHVHADEAKMKDNMKVVVLGADATCRTFDNPKVGAAHFLQRLDESRMTISAAKR